MKHIEAMKLVRQKLAEIHPGNMTPMAEKSWNESLTMLDQAIAEAEKVEPVAYRCWNNPQNADGTFDILRIWVSTKPEGYGNEPLYTAPPPRQPEQTVAMLQEIARLHDRIKDLERDVEFLSQPRQPLTDEQIDGLDCINILWDDDEDREIIGIRDFARAIEAAHGIKENT